MWDNKKSLTAQWPWVPSKRCSPSPVMATFPYEWKIIEWDEKHQTSISCDAYSTEAHEQHRSPERLNIIDTFAQIMIIPLRRFRENTLFLECPLPVILFTQECFVLSLVKIGSVVLLKIIYKFCQCIFDISLSFVLKKSLVQIDFFYPRMLCVNFCRNWLISSMVEDF